MLILFLEMIKLAAFTPVSGGSSGLAKRKRNTNEQEEA